MIALLVKPAAMKKPSHRRIVDELIKNGAVLIGAHIVSDIRNEVQELLAIHAELTVVACGGDGTVHLLANAVIGLPITFAVIPMGTGNDFARYLKIASTQSGIEALHGEHVRDLDVGHIRLDSGPERIFMGITSCGFDAQVNERANTYRGPQGTLKYVAALIAELRNLTALHVDVELDGETEKREIVLLAVGNTSSYGGGMKVCPAANASDGIFDVIAVQNIPRSLLLRVFPRVFTGSHISHPKVQSHRAEKVRISGAQFPMYADGERVGLGPATVTIKPKALRVKAMADRKLR